MTHLSRRQFLQTSAMLTAAAAMPGIASATPLDLPIGIQLYTVGADIDKDAPAAIKQVAAIGYKEVETAGFGSLKTASAFRKVLDDNGLKCPSAHLNFDMNALNKSFEDAHALGCTYATSSAPELMLWGINYSSDMSPVKRTAAMARMMMKFSQPLSPDDFMRLADILNTIGAAAKKSGLTFASHNHTFEFAPVGGKPGIDYLISHTDPATVKFEIDCGWATVADYKPGDIAKAHPGRVRMLHIKDFIAIEPGARAGGPGSPKGTEIGKGVVDYKEIFASMDGVGIQHIFVEQEAPFTMPVMQSAKIDYDYLKSIG